jgi:hypothetical protein
LVARTNCCSQRAPTVDRAGDEQLYAVESDLSRSDYTDVLDNLGYRRADLQPKYAHSDTVQRLGVFPAWYHTFERS